MKKKHAAILAALLALILVLGGVLLSAVRLYRGTGLAAIASFDEDYTYNGKLLLSKDRDRALLVHTLGEVAFLEKDANTLDLSDYGFAGESLSYFQYSFEDDYGVITHTVITPDDSYEGLWPVMKPDRLLYVDREGKKYCVHPGEGLCYPMFSDSISGVDPYGQDVLAFSGNGSYALALSGTDAVIYHTDPMDRSLRVVDVKKVSLKEYGKDIRFGAFTGNTTAYLEGDNGFFALDCATGDTAPALFDGKGSISSPISRVFAQSLEENRDETRGIWSHLLLGTKHTSPKLKGFSSVRLTCVSPQGTYAVGEAEGDEKNEILVLSDKRAFSLSSVLEEGEQVAGVDFVYENLLFVHLLTRDGGEAARCYKICF